MRNDHAPLTIEQCMYSFHLSDFGKALSRVFGGKLFPSLGQKQHRQESICGQTTMYVFQSIDICGFTLTHNVHVLLLTKITFIGFT